MDVVANLCCRARAAWALYLRAALLVVAAAISWLSAADADAAKRHVLVAPFENQSTAHCMVSYEVNTNADPNNPKRSFTVDRYSEAPRAILEDALVNVPGTAVLERQRVDSMLLESEMGRVSGLVDEKSAAQMGKLMGAQVIIMGTILRVDAQVRAFSGYGVATRNTVVTATVRIRAVDIASGVVLASGTYDGSKSYAESQFGGVADSDVAYAVLDAAIRKVTADKDFMNALSGKAAADAAEATVQVAFTPTPAGCDIIVDGAYRGSAPLTIGLVTGKAVTVRFEKAGFTPWERSIVPGTVTTVNPTLATK